MRVQCEQRFHFPAECCIAFALFLQHGSALIGREIHHRLKQFLSSRVALSGCCLQSAMLLSQLWFAPTLVEICKARARLGHARVIGGKPPLERL